MRLTAEQFKQSKNKRLTLLGMSGVGKTHLSKLLSNKDKWYHYSGDYRIGAEYLNQAILDNIKHNIRQDDWLGDLLDNKSISIENHITFDNLSSVSAFLGKVGNPEQGGLPIDEFTRRQALHQEAEVSTMLDVPHFIEKETLDEFTKSLGEKVDNIFDEKFDAAPEFRKCSRCDYASICDAKEEV